MSQAITCLHIADLHFGVELYGYTNTKTGMNSRLEDFSRSLEQAVDYALEHEVDLVLFAGDAYKRNSPSPTEQRELVRHFCRIADAGIPTVMISGNHDIPVMHGRAASIDIFRRLRPNQFYVCINHPTVGDFSPPIIETKNGAIAVCCFPYISPSYLRNLPRFRDYKADDLPEAYYEFIDDVIHSMANQVPQGIPKVLLAHMTVHGAMFGGYRESAIMSDEVQILPIDLINAGYDYVALGHIHQYQNVSPKPEVPVVYCGSIDRVDFGEVDEEKGFVVAQVETGKTEHQLIPIHVRSFVDIHVDSERGEDLTEKIVTAIKVRHIEGSVVRLSYVADDDEVQSLDMKRIHETLKPAHYKAGFFRVPRHSVSRRREVSISHEISLSDALNAYLSEHQEWKGYTSEVLKKAKEIARKVEGDKL